MSAAPSDLKSAADSAIAAAFSQSKLQPGEGFEAVAACVSQHLHGPDLARMVERHMDTALPAAIAAASGDAADKAEAARLAAIAAADLLRKVREVLEQP